MLSTADQDFFPESHDFLSVGLANHMKDETCIVEITGHLFSEIGVRHALQTFVLLCSNVLIVTTIILSLIQITTMNILWLTKLRPCQTNSEVTPKVTIFHRFFQEGWTLLKMEKEKMVLIKIIPKKTTDLKRTPDPKTILDLSKS